MTNPISGIHAVVSTSAVDPMTQVMNDLQQLEKDIGTNKLSNLQADFNKFMADAKTLINTEGSKFPAFTAFIEKMVNNPTTDPLTTFAIGFKTTPANKFPALGEVKALSNLLAGTTSLTDVATDLENLQEEIQKGDPLSELQITYNELLQDSYALKDEGAAPVSYQVSFHQMMADPDKDPLYLFMDGGGSSTTALAEIASLLKQLES